MKNTALVVAVFALPLVLAAFAVGWTLSSYDGTGGSQAVPSPAQLAPPAEPDGEAVAVRTVGGEDVPGEDIAGLPRPPDSTRVVYGQERGEGMMKTRTEYLTEAGPDELRAFYRRHFDSEAWVVADLGFSPEEWYFFVVKEDREALVQIHALMEPVVVEIELTDPDGDPGEDAARPVQPAPAPQPAPEPQPVPGPVPPQGPDPVLEPASPEPAPAAPAPQPVVPPQQYAPAPAPQPYGDAYYGDDDDLGDDGDDYYEGEDD